MFQIDLYIYIGVLSFKIEVNVWVHAYNVPLLGFDSCFELTGIFSLKGCLISDEIEETASVSMLTEQRKKSISVSTGQAQTMSSEQVEAMQRLSNKMEWHDC